MQRIPMKSSPNLRKNGRRSISPSSKLFLTLCLVSAKLLLMPSGLTPSINMRQTTSPASPALATHPVSLISPDLSPSVPGTLIQLQQCMAVTPQKVIDAALNTIDERFKENELDIFRSLKDVTCSNPSKIIKISSVQKVSETYDLDMEKNKGGDTNFSENVQKNTSTLCQKYPRG
ncbi:hypothetical protein AVEN_75679-1 [Araneus ventricosus]|uniref:Uncharacterized protein n=1 Tax=Araneus ventricosus TaxID=182803 RepID=A0A4Y2D6M4_ARAVE|nr:hypothetical protein AVEN_75679-1 [Araneus ventricosus]